MKHLSWIGDSKGIRCSLRALRTKEKKEVGIVMVEDEETKPIIEVELSKLNHQSFTATISIKNMPWLAVQMVKSARIERMVGGVQLRRAGKFS